MMTKFRAQWKQLEPLMGPEITNGRWRIRRLIPTAPLRSSLTSIVLAVLCFIPSLPWNDVFVKIHGNVRVLSPVAIFITWYREYWYQHELCTKWKTWTISINFLRKDKIITLFNEGYTVRQKSIYIINKIVHIYKSNLQCGLLM